MTSASVVPTLRHHPTENQPFAGLSAASCESRVSEAGQEIDVVLVIDMRDRASMPSTPSRDGADLLLQVRCAVYNGTLGAGFGHRFDRIGNANLALAKAA
jgi:hypothetical protein